MEMTKVEIVKLIKSVIKTDATLRTKVQSAAHAALHYAMRNNDTSLYAELWQGISPHSGKQLATWAEAFFPIVHKKDGNVALRKGRQDDDWLFGESSREGSRWWEHGKPSPMPSAKGIEKLVATMANTHAAEVIAGLDKVVDETTLGEMFAKAYLAAIQDKRVIERADKLRDAAKAA